MPNNQEHVVKIPPMRDTENIIPPKIDIPPIPPDTPNTTAVHGRATWKPCWRRACYLSKFIYKDPKPEKGFHTVFEKEMAEVDKRWEPWGDGLNKQQKSGLVARLYKVKGYDPDKKADVCPPTLVFRGTDFEDFRGLKVGVTLEVYDIGPIFILVQPTSPYYQIAFGDAARKQTLADGYVPTTIIDNSEWLRLPGATKGYSLPVSVGYKLEYFGKADGDWNNNIQQGLGHGSAQYTGAIKYGLKQVSEKIKPGQDHRLEIAGHSLGGGLAAATCAVLESQFPSIDIHGTTFNAAGVHPNTIAPATGASVNAFYVNNEILTTLQSKANTVPVIGAVFNWARANIGETGLPPALGNLIGMPPYELTEDIANAKPLPVLWPLSQETLVLPRPNDFATITKLNDLLSSSASPGQAINNLLQYMDRTYHDEAVRQLVEQDKTAFVWRMYEEAARLFLKDAGPELAALQQITGQSVADHGMDYVIAAYEHRVLDKGKSP